VEIVQEMTRSKISLSTKSFKMPRFLHWHNNYEICQVMKNKCTFFVNGEYIDAVEGDFVVVGENIVHRFIAEEKTEVRILQFSLKVLIDAGITPKRLKMHITAEEISKIPELDQKIKMLLALIEAEGRTAAGGENIFQQCIVAAFYSLLMCHFEERNLDDINKEQREFFEIIQYITEHFEEDININALSERLYMYRGKLSTIFKKYSGMSPNEYIYSLRIKKANELMNQGYDIMESALQSGFQNVRTFNYIYKKMTGITPTEYKKGSVSAK